jgi:hypothetical protein
LLREEVMRAESSSGSRRSLRTCGEVSPLRAAPLAWVERLETLEDVLRRGLSIVDVVVQDEYTHDIVTHAGELYVVFDST